MSGPYVFGPLERRGIFLGLRLGQLTAGLIATVLVVTVLDLWPTPLGAVLALTLVAAAAASAVVPLYGRTAEEWTPVVVAFSLDALRGQHRWTSPGDQPRHRLTTAGAASADVVDRAPEPGEVRRSRAAGTASDAMVTAVRRADAGELVPPYLRDLQLLAATWNQGVVGVIKDARRHTYVGVLAARGRGFTLLDTPEKERLLAGWGSVLGNLARSRSAVTCLQWLERTVPDDSEEVLRTLQDGRALGASSPFVRSYLALLDEAGPRTQQHEVLLCVQVSARHAAPAVGRGGSAMDLAGCELLSRELGALGIALRDAEIEVLGVLNPGALATALRNAVDPASRAQLGHRAAVHVDLPGASPSNATPRGSRATWSSFQTEGAHHATYWVAEWPRTPVGADWLTPLLVGTRCWRSVSVVMAPTAADSALRRAEASRVDDETTASLRARFGFRSTVRQRREEENVARAEEELNEGHVSVALSAYITVTAANSSQLEDACAEVEQQAGHSGLDIRREYGSQDVAFTYTLPLCRGLR